MVGTWSYGRADPRLFDEALSWCCQYGDVVHTKRLNNLVSKVDSETGTRIAGARDSVIRDFGECDGGLGLEIPRQGDSDPGLFLSEELQTQSVGRSRDPAFGMWGLARGPFEVRELASPPDVSDARLAQLFARHLMGMGCRGEVFGLLLCGFEATTSELSNMSVYSRRLVQDVLGDFKDAGVLDWERSRGRTTRPSLRKGALAGFHSPMSRNAEGLPPAFEPRDWPSFFRGLYALWEAIFRISEQNLEGFKAQSVLRDGLDDAYAQHSRARYPAIAEPVLSAESMEELPKECHAYIDRLFEE